MPFTFTHPAIVLPLALLPRHGFSVTGLVIGSLTPDFEYFLRMRVRSDFSHTIGGLVWFDLPMGLFLTFLFHNLIRDCLFNNLPEVLKSRLLPYTKFNWKDYFQSNWPVVAVSILVGAASHLLWDSFTHEHGYFVQVIPALTETVNILGRHLPIYKVLQHASTLTGGVVIAAVLYKIPTSRIANSSINVGYWVALVTITFLVIAARVISGIDPKMYGHLIATAIAGFLLALSIAPFLLMESYKR